MPSRRVFSTSGSIFGLWWHQNAESVLSETQWQAGRWLPVQMDHLVFGFLMKRAPSSWSLCTQTCWGHGTGFYSKFHSCSRGRSTWELSWCLRSRLSKVLGRWDQLHTLPYCHVCNIWVDTDAIITTPELMAEVQSFRVGAGTSISQQIWKGKHVGQIYAVCSSFHLPVRISYWVAAFLIWCKSNL